MLRYIPLPSRAPPSSLLSHPMSCAGKLRLEASPCLKTPCTSLLPDPRTIGVLLQRKNLLLSIIPYPLQNKHNPPVQPFAGPVLFMKTTLCKVKRCDVKKGAMLKAPAKDEGGCGVKAAPAGAGGAAMGGRSPGPCLGHIPNRNTDTSLPPNRHKRRDKGGPAGSRAAPSAPVPQ